MSRFNKALQHIEKAQKTQILPKLQHLDVGCGASQALFESEFHKYISTGHVYALLIDKDRYKFIAFIVILLEYSRYFLFSLYKCLQWIPCNWRMQVTWSVSKL